MVQWPTSRSLTPNSLLRIWVGRSGAFDIDAAAEMELPVRLLTQALVNDGS